jgi:hypothetical protein
MNKQENPIKDMIGLSLFLLFSPIYLFCDFFSGGLDR